LVAFVPLFAAEQIAHDNGKKHFFFIAYVSFLIWNLITTFWVWFATPPGAVMAFILNTLQMAVIFALFRWMRKLTNGFLPYIFFCIAWLAWEHVYCTWLVTWPWLILGNSFAMSVKSIQWYEFTGVLGGSLWILLTNMLLFRLLLLKSRGKAVIKSALSLLVLVVLPLTISHIMYYSYNEKENPVHFGILQPNIDPYNDKFGGLSKDEQNDILLKLSAEAILNKKDANNFILLAPETFFTPDSWSTKIEESNPLKNPHLDVFAKMLNTFNVGGNNLSMIVGAVTYKEYFKGEKPTPTSTKFNSGWYDSFNTAIYLSSGSNGEVETDFYHKSKLVILAESNPFLSGPFKFMDRLVMDIAGGIGNFGTQKERSVFVVNDSCKVGTAICYESIFADYYREWVLNGANVMTIITNDGWWKNTPGHKQHLNYARLRAIENRRSIARSANTGISAFINQRGDVVSETQWWKECYLNGVVNSNNELTIFTQYGDIIGRLSGFLFFLFVLMGIARFISKKYIVKEVFEK
jgi:apolipoprotein N-acyltransferase